MANSDTSPSVPRLDEWTESAIREVLNAGLKHGPRAANGPPNECELCRKPIDALRSRIRELIEEAVLAEKQRILNGLRALDAETFR